MSKRVYIQSGHSNSGWWMLFIMAFAIIYARELILAAAIMFVAFAIAKYLGMREQKRAIPTTGNDEITALRAELEDALAQAGDPAGIYGQYEAATIPMTRDILDDHDDGMRGWK